MTKNIEFIKISNEEFSAMNNSFITNTVNEIIKKISLDTVDKYQDNINSVFEDQIVSRLITSEFNIQYPDYFSNNNLFIRINLSYNNKKIIITMGKVLDGESQKILNGVIYP